MVLPTVGADVPLTLWPDLCTVLLLLGCLVQPHYEDFCFVLVSCYVPFGCSLLEPCSFLKGNGGGLDLGKMGDSGKDWEEWMDGKL